MYKRTSPYPIPFLLLSLFMGLGMGIGSLYAQEDAGKLYRQGQVLHAQNRHKEAVTKYESAIASDPGNYRYHLQLGRALYHLEQYEPARTSLLQALALNSEELPSSVYFMIGKTYRIGSDAVMALHYYEQAAIHESNPRKRAQYHLLILQTYLDEGDLEQARVYLGKAREDDPTNVTVLFFEGEIAAADENWEAAKQAYEKALRTTDLREEEDPEKLAKYYYGLGLALSNLGDEEGAKKAFKRADFGRYKGIATSQLAQQDPKVYYQIAVSYFVNQEYVESERFIRKVLEIYPEYPNAFVLRARIALKNGKPADAIDHYKTAIRLEPEARDQAKLLIQLANLELTYGKASAALKSVEGAIAAYPQTARSSSLMRIQAQAQYQSGRHQEAIASLEKLLSGKLDQQKTAQYSFMLGMAAKKSGDIPKARAAFQKATYGPYRPAAENELANLEGGNR